VRLRLRPRHVRRAIARSRRDSRQGRVWRGACTRRGDEGGSAPKRKEALVFKTAYPFEFQRPEADGGSELAGPHDEHRWDIGYVDNEGFIYLTGRESFMIISGGVNIYPQECENRLVTHAKVRDASVFGVTNEEMGEGVQGPSSAHAEREACA
jgi:long-chain acyl-CoA synthetase